jgi:hypothetical protein
MQHTSRISVVVVSDYEASEEKSWAEEHKNLKALSKQDIQEPFDVILVENSRARDSVPASLYQIIPHLKIIFAESSQSAILKDYGTKHVQTEFVAVMEADCVPNEKWLRILVDSLRKNNAISIVSGRTTYGDETMYKRVMSVLDRSFDNMGRPSHTVHVSNNGALYRREILEKFPYPPAATPFLSSRMRMNAMIKEGVQFVFEPQAVMRHAIGGLDFIRDFRRNTGFSDMMMNQNQKVSAIPILLWKRWIIELKDCFRLGPKYLRWYDWPLVFILLFVVPFFEIPGMLDAAKGASTIPNSAYR